MRNVRDLARRLGKSFWLRPPSPDQRRERALRSALAGRTLAFEPVPALDLASLQAVARERRSHDRA
jgi:hypothetical protein